MILDIRNFMKDQFERKQLISSSIDPKELYLLFRKKFIEIEGQEFVVTEESKSLVFTLIYFFQKKDNFYKSSLLYSYPKTRIDLNKGLLIVGGFGCGKTSI